MTRRSSAAARSTQPAAETPDWKACEEIARRDRARYQPALLEADRLYGGDLVAEMEAIAAGTHPSQRGLDPGALRSSQQKAIAVLAQRPAQ
jgi:hypothetical protein